MSLALIAASGCGFGSGEGTSGRAELVVTRDHGAERLVTGGVEDPSSSETVARFLDREAEIETSYGGNFVDSIEGVAGSLSDGSRSDWFFYVNGYWSPLGAAEAEVHAGDRIWWDHRRWDVAYRVPVVVGSWPAPFESAPGTAPVEVELDCRPPTPCEEIRSALEGAGANVGDPQSAPADAIRVVAGLWDQVLSDPDARLLGRGPSLSGVYVEAQDGQPAALDAVGDPAGPQLAGLVAAVRRGEGPPTWIVTGLTRPALAAAASSLNEQALGDRYALGISPGGSRFPLPVNGS